MRNTTVEDLSHRATIDDPKSSKNVSFSEREGMIILMGKKGTQNQNPMVKHCACLQWEDDKKRDVSHIGKLVRSLMANFCYKTKVKL
ncbi:hypothetical protein TNCT_399371 [Trichonephila clavata]|uniref:Uncharacterized protein n=1 Tax=Trichonephila clavata TaxID=2740835 RepID=A0A8X6H0W8_TRICU|nr:hypothetical protein TNCT_399371 [Trichonephila clavata]